MRKYAGISDKVIDKINIYLIKSLSQKDIDVIQEMIRDINEQKNNRAY
jgi:hypothetical protein